MKIFGPYKTNKRASMQLSINAIVILVMAMAVLGLGLAMVRGLLGDGVTRLEDAIDGVNLQQTATSGEPLANINTLSVQRGSTTSVFISYYNEDDDDCVTGAQMNLSCQYIDDSDPDNPVETTIFDSVNSLSVPAEKGRATTLGAEFETKSNVDIREYLCTVSVICGGNSAISEATRVQVEG